MNTVTAVVLVCVVSAALALDWPIVRSLKPEPQPTSLADSNSQERIILGSTAPKNAYPYQVGIEIRVPAGYTWCGGAVLSSNYVLTAAHCVDSAISVIIFFGVHDRTNSAESGQIRKSIDSSRYFKVHSGWSPSSLRNDIALIQLPEKIAFSGTIQPIKLPPRGVQQTTFEESPAVATGWGHTFGKPSLAQYLQHVDITIQKQEVCNSFLSPWVQQSNICTDGSYGKGACYGDSGSPLVSTGGSRYIIGVASFIGYYGCEANWPTVYTRVTTYLDWISENTGINIS